MESTNTVNIKMDGLTIFPNPSSQWISINSSNPSDVKYYIIYNSSGQEIRNIQQIGMDIIHVPIWGLSNGVYTLLAYGSDHKSKSRTKFVIARD